MEFEKIIQNAYTDTASFRALYERTVSKVFRYLLTRTGNRDLALDITQDVYVSLWKSLPKFVYRDDAHFYGFLFTVVRRRLFRATFGRGKSVELTDEYDIGVPETEQEDYRYLVRAVHTLPDKQQLVIQLRYFSDFSFKEIAAALATTEGNAKVIHHRAIHALERYLSPSQ